MDGKQRDGSRNHEGTNKLCLRVTQERENMEEKLEGCEVTTKPVEAESVAEGETLLAVKVEVMEICS